MAEFFRHSLAVGLEAHTTLFTLSPPSAMAAGAASRVTAVKMAAAFWARLGWAGFCKGDTQQEQVQGGGEGGSG